MIQKYSTKEALRVILAASKNYSRLLENKNFVFIYKDRTNNSIAYFETVFLPRHFQHLCGVDYISRTSGQMIKNASDFYNKCLQNQLSETEIRFRPDGTTNLKLEALPKLVSFIQFSKMTVAYNGNRPKLTADRFAGTTHYCLGFTLDDKFYMPCSCLLEDIRNLGTNPSQVLAILSKKNHRSEPQYTQICYIAKGVTLQHLSLPNDLKIKIALSDFD